MCTGTSYVASWHDSTGPPVSRYVPGFRTFFRWACYTQDRDVRRGTWQWTHCNKLIHGVKQMHACQPYTSGEAIATSKSHDPQPK